MRRLAQTDTPLPVAILLSAQELEHRFGARPLFQGVNFTIAEGDRIGLIGPNGAGKSTLLKILAGQLGPDGGTLARKGGLRVSFLSQVPELDPAATVRTVVRAGLGPGHDDHDWAGEARVDELLAKLDLVTGTVTGDTSISVLSGGWRKRVALARALVSDPDLLLLDEPTNHLDVESILWLERLLATARFATLTVTHDRLFLQRVANRILELDRRNPGGLLDVAGDYATYVERKAEAMAAQERREDVLRNTLRRETEWLRRGPPARTTKQDARIQRAGALADEVAELGTRNKTRAVDLDFQGIGKKPRRLIEARGVSKAYGDRGVFRDIDLFIGPGSRIGLLGPNGCGKSTLIRVLLGEETASSGTVLRADNLQVASFEQDRGSLDPDLTLVDTVCPDGDYVHFRGGRQHRHGYLERFLFRSEQMNMTVGMLSGGEQARLLVARLMLRPANLLVLDEPTNDLDLATLAVLEDALTGFDGAVLLVTHDRFFLDQVATEILAFHTKPGEEGQITSFAGLQQWQEWYPSQQQGGPGKKRGDGAEPGRGDASGKKKKLGFKDQRDWETIDARIGEAETKVGALEAECTKPEVASDGARLVALMKEIEDARAEVDRLYSRWEELSRLVGG
jgi:ABC transport system ATP-binding/permease protein